MREILYSSPFVPPEWIDAHGFTPRWVVPHFTGYAPAAGVCIYAQAFIDEVGADSSAAGAVFATTCDQMRRVIELLGRTCEIPLFLLNVPSTWEQPAAQRLYTDELCRLGRFLVDLGGQPPADEQLAHAMAEFDDVRRRLCNAREAVAGADFTRLLLTFRATGRLDGIPREKPARPAGIPLALLGGPLLARDVELLDLIEQAGGTIVLDGSESGERTLPLPFDRRRMHEAPLRELASAYFNGIPDAFRRPNTALYQWLARELKTRAVRGMILKRYPWCDIWHAEAARLREWASVPLLDVDFTEETGTRAALTNRILSFLETLS